MDITNVAGELLEMARLSEREAEEYVARALDPAYWASLARDARPLADAGALPQSQIDDVVRSLDEEGWFAVAPVIAREATDVIRQRIDSVRNAGWPAVFAFMYDEPWQVYRSTVIRQLARAAIGDDAVQTGYFWAHYVPPLPEGRGWTPHADANALDEPKRLTVWIAITDATLDNGCMYIIPRRRTAGRTLEQFFDGSTFDRATTLRLLQSSRAVPAPAGSILGWEFRTVHWGSVVHRPVDTPRISISAELIRDSELDAGETRLPLDAIPDFPLRLRLIANAIKTYVHWDMQFVRYEPVVRRILERGAA